MNTRNSGISLGNRKAIGIRDIAKRAEVSTATVSRFLNNPASVGVALRHKIDKVIEETGYIPHASARALSSRRNQTIGAIVPTVDNAMFAQGIQALQSFLASNDYLLLLATNEYDLETELRQARNLVARGIDALILRGDRHHPTLHRLLAANSIPFINVGVYEPAKPYPSVGVDNREAGRELTRYITGLGHKHIAVVAAHQRNNDRAQARLDGILSVLTENGCSPPDEWILHVDYNLSDAGDAARMLLQGADRPTAIICGNDVIAYGVMMAAIRLGVAVPQDLSVVGFDDLEWSRHLQPSLTTIHMPTNEIWTRAGRYLVEVLADNAPVLHQQVQFHLVVRESTAPPR